MEILTTTTVENLLNKLKPGPFERWDCSENVKNELQELANNATIVCLGESSFRLADDFPSFYVESIIVKN